jgi:hypothetical protein
VALMIQDADARAVRDYYRPKKGSRRKGRTLKPNKQALKALEIQAANPGASERDLADGADFVGDERSFARKVKRHKTAYDQKRLIDALADDHVRNISEQRKQKNEQRLIKRGVKIERPKKHRP